MKVADNDSQSFQGKTAVITGSSRGIGKETAVLFARRGANVVINYLNNKELAEQVLATIKESDGEAVTLQADVSKRNEVKTLYEKAYARFGSIDILVNNAGYLEQKPFRTITDEDWDLAIDINLKGAFICIQEVEKYFLERKTGSVINITSVGGQIGGDKAPHYAAAKAGLISLTKSFARLLSPVGIRVNAVAPGFIKTDMYFDIITRIPPEEINRQILLGRAGEPSELAEAVLFLASDAASYITGHVLNVNGGLFLGSGS